MGSMKISHIALTLAVLMGGAAIGATAARPSTKAVDRGLGIRLESAVPKTFGDWSELPESNAQVVNPQAQEYLNKLYSQILTRTYVDRSGYRIMLSMAYGDDQRGGLKAHKPEQCYPAQGFKLHKIEDGTVATAFGPVEVRRLNTSLGQRVEPVTYWLTVGDRVIKNGIDKRLAEIRLGLTGQIPDGLLFRVSSIDTDSPRAFAQQQKFIADMMASVPPETRRQLSGLVPGAKPA